MTDNAASPENAGYISTCHEGGTLLNNLAVFVFSSVDTVVVNVVVLFLFLYLIVAIVVVVDVVVAVVLRFSAHSRYHYRRRFCSRLHYCCSCYRSVQCSVSCVC